ncbi:M67 family metallopeptidase [Paenibacillus sp. HB172176]|uniref:M67 family metallopeptidase n=1 Tax=Paenibacillus sp. HB172176 TaxID=2493690 RepID=UPI00143B89BB|nr:M67 family metallopeptidase [Paenibacillus sp. HB172176]
MQQSIRQELIRRSVYEELIAICTAGLPSEVCGILIRNRDSEMIDEVLPIQNVHHTPLDSFAFDPVEWTQAYFNMQKNRQSLVGFFHSHPRSEAVPSMRDGAGFLPLSTLSYWIISLQDRKHPVAQPYRYANDTFQPTSLVLA